MRNSRIPTGEVIKRAEKVIDTAQLIEESINRMLKIMDDGEKRVAEIMGESK